MEKIAGALRQLNAALVKQSRIQVMFPWFQQDEVPPDVARRVKGDAREVSLNTGAGVVTPDTIDALTKLIVDGIR